MSVIAPPWTPQQQYKFSGTLNDPGEPVQNESFYVLAGEKGPVPKGGWPKVSTIDRARRKGFTMVIGYDPLAMDVDIQFIGSDAYGASAWSPSDVERDIQILEWMAGRGKLYANGTSPTSGDPPLVQVSSFMAGSQVSTNLIPPTFQSDLPSDLRWVISDLAYGDSTRNARGDRTLQQITVSLSEFVAVPGVEIGPRQRQTGRGTSTTFKSYKATLAHNTIAKVAIAHGINKASAWSTIVSFNLSTLHQRSYNAALKVGTVVKIPDSLFQ